MQYTPAQQEVIDQLGATPADRPTFPSDLRARLRQPLEEAAADIVALIPDDETLVLGKRALAIVLACPARYLAERETPFEWSIPVARGSVAHKAIELSVFWPVETTPRELVDEAMAKLAADEAGLGRFIQGLSTADAADLAGQVNARVAAFLECWPPLNKRWRPVLEGSVRVELAEGRVLLAGKVDLALGRADGLQAGKVIVDLKTGGFSPSHRDDLRFYALLDTLRLGVPPRRLATYYLDQGRFTPEDVREAVLDAAVARTVDAMYAVAELQAGLREPERRPSTACRWCPARTTCHPGRRYLAEQGYEEDVTGADDLGE